MKGRQLNSHRSDLSLGGSTDLAGNCCIPSSEKGAAGSGSLLKQDPFFSHSGSGLGIAMTQSFHHCLQEGQAPASSRPFPLVLVGHKESCLGVGDSGS